MSLIMIVLSHNRAYNVYKTRIKLSNFQLYKINLNKCSNNN